MASKSWAKCRDCQAYKNPHRPALLGTILWQHMLAYFCDQQLPSLSAV